MRATIAFLPGDGIGPEVLDAARLVLEAVAARFGHDLRFEPALIGGAAIDATGDPLPPATLDVCRRADAVLLGAVGGPRWDDPAARVRPEQGLLGLRRALGLFANLRPVVPHPRLAERSPIRAELLRGVDFVVVRELTGGLYFGEKRRERRGAEVVARDECVYSVSEIERVARVAGTLARARRRTLHSVDKANVLETSRLWREVVTRVITDEFSEVRLINVLVDACAMHLIQRPRDFDVIVTENMFGDILTDEAAVLAGSIGVLPSASLGARDAAGRGPGLYEPIHGSAPTLAGRDVANPVGAILSAAMLLRESLGLDEEARAVESAVRRMIDRGIVTADLAAGGEDGAGTAAVARVVVAELGSGAPLVRAIA